MRRSEKGGDCYYLSLCLLRTQYEDASAIFPSYWNSARPHWRQLDVEWFTSCQWLEIQARLIVRAIKTSACFSIHHSRKLLRRECYDSSHRRQLRIHHRHIFRKKCGKSSSNIARNAGTGHSAFVLKVAARTFSFCAESSGWELKLDRGKAVSRSFERP